MFSFVRNCQAKWLYHSLLLLNSNVHMFGSVLDVGHSYKHVEASHLNATCDGNTFSYACLLSEYLLSWDAWWHYFYSIVKEFPDSDDT